MIGDRCSVLENPDAPPLIVHVVQAEKKKLPYEAIFRSVQRHLMDTATSECVPYPSCTAMSSEPCATQPTTPLPCLLTWLPRVAVLCFVLCCCSCRYGFVRAFFAEANVSRCVWVHI